MNVEQVMVRRVCACRPTDSLAVAAQLMWDGDCAWVPVLSGDGSQHVVGVITARDICMALHRRDRRLPEVAVSEVMSTRIRSVRGTETVADAEAIMRDARVRRLPVVDERERLVGVVSLADLARLADRMRQSAQPPLADRDVVAALAALSTPEEPPSHEVLA